MANPWPNCRKLPVSAAAALAALHLREPRMETLEALSDSEWRGALEFCDRSRLTLALRGHARESMPDWVRERTDRNAANNLQRLAGVEATCRELAGCLGAAGVEFAALKGITHSVLFGIAPALRAQYDIDLFAPPDRVYAARDALLAAGYESVQALEGFPTDHLPVLVRKTGWEWSGDYFDTGIPLSVDLHFRFWNERLERLPAPGCEDFWERRVARVVAGSQMNVLCPADAMGYAALHLLRHLFRGSVSPFHVYEMALVVDSRSGDRSFWNQWREGHGPELRRLEAVVFRLAAEWFGCRLPEAAEEEMRRLSPTTQAWFSEFATSPAVAPFRPNKDELWLHCSLTSSRRDAWSVARRRLLPGNLPPWGPALYVPKERLSWRKRAQNVIQYTGYAAGRAWHHVAALPQVAASGARWWWTARDAVR